MTKLKEFLNDSSNLEFIKNDCKEFLRAWSPNIPLFRGMSNVSNLSKHKVRKDRRSLDSMPHVHNWLNNLYKKASGYYLRTEALFCTLSKRHSKMYGTSYIVVPCDPYKIFVNSSKIIDPIILFSESNDFDMHKDIKEILDFDKVLFDNFPILKDKNFDKLVKEIESICLPKHLISSDQEFLDIAKKRISNIDLFVKIIKTNDFEILLPLKQKLLHNLEKNYGQVVEVNKSSVLPLLYSSKELMIICDEYYAIDAYAWNELWA